MNTVRAKQEGTENLCKGELAPPPGRTVHGAGWDKLMVCVHRRGAGPGPQTILVVSSPCCQSLGELSVSGLRFCFQKTIPQTTGSIRFTNLCCTGCSVCFICSRKSESFPMSSKNGTNKYCVAIEREVSDVVVHFWDPSIPEAEEGGLGGQGQLGLHRPCLKKKE